MIEEASRQLRVGSPLGKDRLFLASMEMHEEISTLYEMRLNLYSDDPSIAFDDILGHNISVGMVRPKGGERRFNGFVTQFGFAGSRGRRYIYRAVAAPWLWFLTQTETCRIFHEKSALDIVKSVFDQHGFSDYRDDTTGSPSHYEYCVQYRESDFNFVSRLLEQEGISYYFEHEEDRHELVLVDEVSSLGPEPGYEDIDLFARDRTSELRREGIFTWRPQRQVLPTRVTLTDFDFKKPGTDLTRDANVARGHALSGLEVYRYPGVYTEPGDGAEYARKRAEAIQSGFEHVEAEANCRGLRSGTVFRLNDHPIAAFNRDYVVRAVWHEISGDVSESGQDDGEIYRAMLTAVPDDAPFRPALRAVKPHIVGPQTAMVKNDTDGEEIEPDEHGRVKVAFHWEREGESSCWVRVSQAWAGNAWGAMSIPRDGQEVVVEFINGDPDRPLITGRVYNGDSVPPYPPKDKRTVTTFKTDSSKGGGGFNELRFDDEKGSENVFIHAEKDFDLRTKKVRREVVGKDVHTEIKEKEFRKVGQEQHEEIGHTLYLKTGQDMHRKAGMNVMEEAGMEYVLNAGTNLHLKAGGNAVIEAEVGLTIKVGSSFVTLNPGGVFISGPMVTVNGGGAPLSGSGTKPQPPDSPDEARTSEPGAATSPARARSCDPDQSALDAHPVAAAMLGAAASGAPFCQLCTA